MNTKYSSVPTYDEGSPLHRYNSRNDVEGRSRSNIERQYPHFAQGSDLNRTRSVQSSSVWSPTEWLKGDNQSTRRRKSTIDRNYSRIIDRNDELFAQSGGKTYVAKRMKNVFRYSFYSMDWFHSLIDAPTSRIIFILMTGYLFLVFIFAFFFYEIYKHDEEGCHLETKTFLDAFLFSLETFATIGYGAPANDIFYNECISVTIVITIQCCLRIVVDSVSIGILYSRLARPSSRASTVIFSDKAVVRRIRGKLYFMFQLCELRKHQLVEAHIRLYVIKHEVDPSIYFDELERRRQNSTRGNTQPTRQISILQRNGHPATNHYVFVQSCTMRLNHPNDELGAMLLLMLPQVVVHELDVASPLMPPPLWVTTHGEVIRWNPPVYRALRRKRGEETMFPTGPSSASIANNTNTQYDSLDAMVGLEDDSPRDVDENFEEYDVEAVSNIEFPSVTRRGLEIYGNSPPPLPPLTVSRSNSVADVPRPNMLPTVKRSSSTPQRNPKLNLVADSISNLQNTGKGGGGSVVSGVGSDLESPGMQKYHTDLNSVPVSAYNSRDNSGVTPSYPFTKPKNTVAGIVQPHPSRYYHFDDSLLNNPSQTPVAPPQSTYVPPKLPTVLNGANNGADNRRSPQVDEEDDDVYEEDEPEWQIEEKMMIQKYLHDRKIEIIAVVEGVDATTGGNLQARHSYTCDDLAWDKTFANCIFPGSDDVEGGMTIDFDYFHELRDAPKDAAYPGPIASSI